MSLGQFLPVGSPLVILTNLDAIHVDFTLPEQYLGRVSVGQALAVRLEGHPWQVFPGQVQAIIPEIHRDTRHFEVRAVFGNPDRVLVPGLSARIEWPGSTPEQRVVIPQSAVLDEAVFVIESASDTATPDSPQWISKRRKIRLGPQQGDRVIVLEGLQAGEQVATSNLQSLQEDGPVVVNP
ncbi:hypothetical protein CCP4SC76_7180001 [Gammaproteobacteria bacterium]